MSKKFVAIAAVVLFLSATVTLAQDAYTTNGGDSILIATVTQRIRVKVRKLEGNTCPVSVYCGQRSKQVPNAGPLTFDCEGSPIGVDLIVSCGKVGLTGCTCKFEVTDITK
jgi:hypothetical protein